MAAVEWGKAIRFLLSFFTGDLFLFFQRAIRPSEWLMGNCVFISFSRGIPQNYPIPYSSSCLLGLGSLIIHTLVQGKHSFGLKHLVPHKKKSRCSSGDDSVQKVFSKDNMTPHKLLTSALHSCNSLSVGFAASKSLTRLSKRGNTFFLFHVIKI